ncbi:MAG: hypothetical protein GC149_20470 [Gammaproteobacteria bacterium]|nr:hypothetical protein [Gammaproteobacteria bacterium]
MKKLVLISALIVAGCASPAQITNEQLTAMTDEQLCSTIHKYPTDMRFVQFMMGRGLRCHPAMETCDAAGIDKASDEYTSCIQAMTAQIFDYEAEKKANQARAALAIQQGVQNYQNAVANTPRPVTTNCSAYGSTVNCTSY